MQGVKIHPSHRGQLSPGGDNRALNKQGLSYEVVDLTLDTEALQTVKALGYQQAPVVFTDGDHWAGFRPDKIKALAAPVRQAEVRHRH